MPDGTVHGHSEELSWLQDGHSYNGFMPLYKHSIAFSELGWGSCQNSVLMAQQSFQKKEKSQTYI